MVYASRSDHDHKTNDMFLNRNTTFQPALLPPNVVLGDDRSYDFLDFDYENNEHEDVFDWNNDEDLPHNLDFYYNYCEDLVAMLLLWPEHVD